jgi:penicillin-binding protein 1A
MTPIAADVASGETRRPSWMRRAARQRPRAVGTVALGLSVACWFLGGAAAWFTWDITTGLPGEAQLAGIGTMSQASTLYDRTGRPLFTIFKERRIEVPFARVSPHLTAAIVAVEDQRFYAHRGVDVVRVAASMLANLRSGRLAQGGSTITQQLARQSFLTRDKTWRRKAKEALLAAQIERRHTKADILELYLNKVYFGEGFHGVEAAALGYFGKPAAELDLAESALIAGLVQSPSAYAPTANPDRAIARRDVVLGAMRATGAIDDAAFEAARGVPLRLRRALGPDEPFGQYVKEMVRRQLVERLGWERVAEGGLRVYTTVDGSLQEQAEQIVEAHLRDLEGRRGFARAPRALAGTASVAAETDAAPDYLQAALVVADTATGEIRALVGGRSFEESRFNRAVQARRQPGSAFKPFVFAAAIEDGASPGSVISGLNDRVLSVPGGYLPDDEHAGASAMTLRSALRSSSNRAAVKLLVSLGVERTVDWIARFGFSDLPRVPSLALGAGEVPVIALTEAFAAFGNGGTVHDPVLVRRVEDSTGALLYETSGTGRRVMSESTAFMTASMLQDVIDGGTGARARSMGFRLPAGGKTGTTNDYRDAWFVGFTRGTVAGVWVGFDRPDTILPGGYAGEVAVPLWTAVMKVATTGEDALWLPVPDGVVSTDLCPVSGRRAGPGCYHLSAVNEFGEVQGPARLRREYYREGTLPGEVCDLHGLPGALEGFEALGAPAGEAPPP